MRPLALVALLAATPLLAAPTGVAGRWHVTGDIAGHAFALDCSFDGAGAKFGGTCINVANGDDTPARPGAVYTLTAGAMSGNAVTWTYSTRAYLMTINLNYAGTLDGDHIVGTVTTIGGRKGPFAAARKS